MIDKYIERYVYDVTSRIDKNIREDVSKELRANIYDMLSDNPSKEEIIKVLKELGKPSVIALEYQDKKKLLISPKYYDAYIKTLLYAVSIFALISFISNAVESIMISSNPTFINEILIIFSSLSKAIFDDGLKVFGIVTIIFLIIEKVNSKNDDVMDWSVEDLKEVPSDSKLEINKTNTIIGLTFKSIFYIFFIYILFNQSKYLGWFTWNESTNQFDLVTLLFNDNVKLFIIGLVVVFSLSLISDIVLLIKGVKNKTSIVLNAIGDIFVSLFLLILVVTKDLLATTLIDKVVESSDLPVEQVLDMIQQVKISIVVICLISIGLYLFFSIRKYIKISKH